MKVCLLGGGNVYALNLARHLGELGIDRFGAGRNRKLAPFWRVINYPYQSAPVGSGELRCVIGIERPDVVINFAAQGEGAASFANPGPFYKTNTDLMIEFAEWLRKEPYLKRFIQISTSELYGSNDTPVSEQAPIRCTSPYAVSKATFDQHLEIMFKVYGFPMNIVRPSNCYCPGQQLHRVIPRAIVCKLKGEKLPLHGGGRARKSYLHATDLSRAILSILQNGAIGETYNVGPDKPISIKELVQMTGVEFEEVGERTGQDGCYWLDSSKLRSLGWKPEIGLKEGLREMEEWVKSYPEILSMDPTYRLIP